MLDQFLDFPKVESEGSWSWEQTRADKSDRQVLDTLNSQFKYIEEHMAEDEFMEKIHEEASMCAKEHGTGISNSLLAAIDDVDMDSEKHMQNIDTIILQPYNNSSQLGSEAKYQEMFRKFKTKVVLSSCSLLKPCGCSVFSGFEGCLDPNPIMILGKLKWREVGILIDNEMTNSLIDEKLLQEMKFEIKPSRTMKECVVDMVGLNNHGIGSPVVWKMHGFEFQYHMRTLRLQGLDIVLGMDWLSQLEPNAMDCFFLSKEQAFRCSSIGFHHGQTSGNLGSVLIECAILDYSAEKHYMMALRIKCIQVHQGLACDCQPTNDQNATHNEIINGKAQNPGISQEYATGYGVAVDTIIKIKMDKLPQEKNGIGKQFRESLALAETIVEFYVGRRETNGELYKGGRLYWKLHLCQKKSPAKMENHKLNFRFFSPFKVQEKFRPVIWKLFLPITAKIHPNIPMILLKKKFREQTASIDERSMLAGDQII